MNIREIDLLIYDMNTDEKSHLLHYLLGYAKSNEQFKAGFVEAINKKYDTVKEEAT